MGIVMLMLLWVIDIPLWTQIVGTVILGLRATAQLGALMKD